MKIPQRLLKFEFKFREIRQEGRIPSSFYLRFEWISAFKSFLDRWHMAREEPSTVENAKLMLTAKKKVLRYLKFHLISVDLNGFRAPEESLNWKTQFPCSQKHIL